MDITVPDIINQEFTLALVDIMKIILLVLHTVIKVIIGVFIEMLHVNALVTHRQRFVIINAVTHVCPAAFWIPLKF